MWKVDLICSYGLLKKRFMVEQSKQLTLSAFVSAKFIVIAVSY